MGREIAEQLAPSTDEGGPGKDSGAARISIRLPEDDAGHPAHKIRVTTIDVGGVPTDLMLQPFADRVFISVSQLNKLGTIVCFSAPFTGEIFCRCASILLTTSLWLTVCPYASVHSTLREQLSVEREVSLGGGESFAVEVLIGRRDEAILELCARQIAASIASTCTKSLILAIALCDHSIGVVKPILDAIEANKVWWYALFIATLWFCKI
jgi:hypothetical protein